MQFLINLAIGLFCFLLGFLTMGFFVLQKKIKVLNELDKLIEDHGRDMEDE